MLGTARPVPKRDQAVDQALNGPRGYAVTTRFKRLGESKEGCIRDTYTCRPCHAVRCHTMRWDAM
eukprot:scaffold1402_cov254-Pinguiococcus_pyrenoidosus.AAC.37